MSSGGHCAIRFLRGDNTDAGRLAEVIERREDQARCNGIIIVLLQETILNGKEINPLRLGDEEDALP
jgi:hypothetical protein